MCACKYVQWHCQKTYIARMQPAMCILVAPCMCTSIARGQHIARVQYAMCACIGHLELGIRRLEGALVTQILLSPEGNVLLSQHVIELLLMLFACSAHGLFHVAVYLLACCYADLSLELICRRPTYDWRPPHKGVLVISAHAYCSLCTLPQSRRAND